MHYIIIKLIKCDECRYREVEKRFFITFLLSGDKICNKLFTITYLNLTLYNYVPVCKMLAKHKCNVGE